MLLAAGRQHVLVVAVAVAVVRDHFARVLAGICVLHACFAAALDASLSAAVAVPFLLAVELLVLEVQVVFVLLVPVGAVPTRLGHRFGRRQTLAARDDRHHVCFVVRRRLESASLFGHAAVVALVNVAWLLVERVVDSSCLGRSLTSWRHVEHPAVTGLGRVRNHALHVQLLVTTAPRQLLDAAAETWNGLVRDVLFGHARLFGHDLDVVVRQVDVWQRQNFADVVPREVGHFFVVAVDEAAVRAVRVVDFLVVVPDVRLV